MRSLSHVSNSPVTYVVTNVWGSDWNSNEFIAYCCYVNNDELSPD